MEDMYGLWTESRTNKASCVQKREHESEDLRVVYKICQLSFVGAYLGCLYGYCMCVMCASVHCMLDHKASLYVYGLNFPG